MPEGATEDEHLALLGVLNSFDGCFWLKQNSHDKAEPEAMGRGIQRSAGNGSIEFNGTNVAGLSAAAASCRWSVGVHSMGWRRKLAAHEPSPSMHGRTPDCRIARDGARGPSRFRARMIAVQEELDWEVYRLYGLIDEDLTYGGDDLPGLRLGSGRSRLCWLGGAGG